MFPLRFQRPELIPALFIACALALTLSLGIWQLVRLHWKETLIAQYRQAQSMPPLENEEAAQLAIAKPERLLYRNAALSGIFLHDKEFHLAGQYHEGRLGYRILTPLKIEQDGPPVFFLIDRGWVPVDKKNPAARPETQAQAQAAVQGVLRPPKMPRIRLIADDTRKNLWFTEDLEAMDQALGEKLAPYVLEATGGAPGVLPLTGSGQVLFRNDHLGYAITWFMLAFAAAVMFAIYHLKRPSAP